MTSVAWIQAGQAEHSSGRPQAKPPPLVIVAVANKRELAFICRLIYLFACLFAFARLPRRHFGASTAHFPSVQAS